MPVMLPSGADVSKMGSPSGVYPPHVECFTESRILGPVVGDTRRVEAKVTGWDHRCYAMPSPPWDGLVSTSTTFRSSVQLPSRKLMGQAEGDA